MSVLRDYGLSVALGALFLLTLTGQWLTHRGDVTEFANRVFENHQSEFLQLLAFVVLSAFLIHRGSPQSKSEADAHGARLRAKLDELAALQDQATEQLAALSRRFQEEDRR